MILGVYYLTREKKNFLGEGMIFNDPNEVLRAYQNNKLHPHAIIGIATKAYPEKNLPAEGILITTGGKVILNEALPKDMQYLNDANYMDHLNPNDIVTKGNDVRKAISD